VEDAVESRKTNCIQPSHSIPLYHVATKDCLRNAQIGGGGRLTGVDHRHLVMTGIINS
jgi:hypothetical protein